MLFPFFTFFFVAACQTGLILGSNLVVANAAVFMSAGRPQQAWAILNERWRGIHPSTIRKPAFQLLLVKVFEGIGDEDAKEAMRFLGLTTEPSTILPLEAAQGSIPHAALLQQGRTSLRWFRIVAITSLAITILRGIVIFVEHEDSARNRAKLCESSEFGLAATGAASFLPGVGFVYSYRAASRMRRDGKLFADRLVIQEYIPM
jgi:hypothetical protein